MNELDLTPETDDALHGVWYRGDHGSAIPALCRRLERERNEARQQLAAMRQAMQEAQERIQAVTAAYDSRFFRAGKWSEQALAKFEPYLIHQ